MIFRILGPFFFLLAKASAQSAWINEFHYDNDSTDVNEFVEIAYTTGLDISGYSIVLYNGNGGGSYSTKLVPSGTDGGAGVSFSVIDVPGIQNGSPDGIALVNGSNNVIQFLSYEGTFTASDGPAAGMVSLDIGVSETTTTPVGHSLQLSGTGCSYSDFIWNSPNSATPGSINNGQSFSCVIPTSAPTASPTQSPTSLPTKLPVASPSGPAGSGAWINEFHYDNASTDVGEFVEIAYTTGLDVSGYSIVLYNGNGGVSYSTKPVPAGTDGGAGVSFSIIDVPGIQNGPDGIALVDGSNYVVEFISYGGSFSATDGPANGMASTDVGVAESSTTAVGNSLQRTGTGCAGSDFTWAAPQPETKGAINVGQSLTCNPPETAWFNEFHYDNDGTDVGEFIEVAYTTGMDISAYSVVLYNGNGGASYNTYSLAPGTDGGSGVTFSVYYIALQNGSPDGIALVDGSGSVVEFISYEGTFAATDGPANGMTSTDIGVSETTTTPVGQSLQRTGTGCSAADFTWTGPATASPGSVNEGQNFDCSSNPTPSTASPTPPKSTTPAPVSGPTPASPAGSTTTRTYTAFELELLCGSTAGYAIRFTYELVGPDLGSAARPSSFYYDNELPANCQQLSRNSYSHTNCGSTDRKTNPYCFDRGHLVMANHMDINDDVIRESNMMTNVLPQAAGFNQLGGAWLETEEIIECARDISGVEKQTIFGGALFSDSSNDYFLTSHGIPTPETFWKVVVRHVTSGTPEVVSWIFPNHYTSTRDKLDSDYIKTVAYIQSVTGDAMPELPASYTELSASWDKPAGCDLSRLRGRRHHNFRSF